jgi:hypothetical protein
MLIIIIDIYIFYINLFKDLLFKQVKNSSIQFNLLLKKKEEATSIAI